MKVMLCKGFEVGFKDGRVRDFYFELAVEVEVDVAEEGGVGKKVLKAVKEGEVGRAVRMMGGGGDSEGLGSEGYRNCAGCGSTRDGDVFTGF